MRGFISISTSILQFLINVNAMRSRPFGCYCLNNGNFCIILQSDKTSMTHFRKFTFFIISS